MTQFVAGDTLDIFRRMALTEKSSGNFGGILMFGIGMPELIIILIIILIIFGAGKLPEIGSGIGKGIKNFKKATNEAQKEIQEPKENNETESHDDKA